METSRISIIIIIFAVLAELCICSSSTSSETETESSEGDSLQQWTDIFRCIDTPGEDIQFYGLDLEDIQALITESNSNQIMISGYFGSKYIELSSKTSISQIVSETLLNGKSISTYDFEGEDWRIKPKSYKNILDKSSDCLTKQGSYIPNIWYEACDNDNGLFIIRNGSQSLCTFEKSSSGEIKSDISISIYSNELPIISNTDYATKTVFELLDETEVWLRGIWTDVQFMSSDEYQDMMSDACLIDVRDEPEWDISRIESVATRISMNQVKDGNITDAEVIDAISSNCEEDELIVIYCTIGWRASEMATHLIEELTYAPSRIYVLSGNILRWGNERKPLINDDGQTHLVHTNSVSLLPLMLPEYGFCC